MNNHPDITEKLLSLKAGQEIELSAMQGWPAGGYLLSQEHVGALQAAWLADRPLLVRGDPGLGKSQLAQAIAAYLDWGLVSVVIHYNTVIDDLLFSVDHLERLHQANRTNGDSDLSIDQYVRPGKVWQSLAPDTLKQYGADKPHQKTGTVLLIDEIDKADASLPNALLEVLNHKVISCPHLTEPVQQAGYPILVVITSNDERLLPMAFIRRCAVLDLHLKTGEAGMNQLTDIYKTHCKYAQAPELSSEQVKAIVDLVLKQRHATSTRSEEYKPGTSEFLDVIRALGQYPETERDRQLEILKDHLICKYQQRQ